MLVTNTTAHAFVLSEGVIITPNVVDLEVADATYQADSTLNKQIDALDEQGFITITGKPADTFPVGNTVSPMLLIANDSTEIPLRVVAADAADDNALQVESSLGTALGVYADNTAGATNYNNLSFLGFVEIAAQNPDQVVLKLDAAAGQSADIFQIKDENHNVRLLFDAAGNFFVNADYLGDVGSGQFKVNQDGGVQIFPPTEFPDVAGLFQIWGTDGQLVLQVRADGTIHARTGGSIHFDL